MGPLQTEAVGGSLVIHFQSMVLHWFLGIFDKSLSVTVHIEHTEGHPSI